MLIGYQFNVVAFVKSAAGSEPIRLFFCTYINGCCHDKAVVFPLDGQIREKPPELDTRVFLFRAIIYRSSLTRNAAFARPCRYRCKASLKTNKTVMLKKNKADELPLVKRQR